MSPTFALRIPGSSPAAKAAVVILATIPILAVWTALAVLIALFGMHQVTFHTNWDVLPDWLWYYRADPQLHRWLVKGYEFGGIALAFGLVLLLWDTGKNRKSQHGDAKFQDRNSVERNGFYSNSGILVCLAFGRYVRASIETHVLLKAPTGSGKGVGVIIPNLLEWDGSSITIDLKGENYDATAGFLAAHGVKVYRVDVLNRSGHTHRFNPLSYIDRESEMSVIGELRNFAEQLYPVHGDDAFWADEAKAAFVGVGAYVAETPELPFTFAEIFRQFVSGDPRARFPEVVRQRATSDRPLSEGCTIALLKFTGANEKTFGNIMSSVTAKFGMFLDPRVRAATSESDFDLADIRHKKMAIFLVAEVNKVPEQKTLLNLIFQQAMSRAIEQGEAKKAARHRVLLVLDEFYQLGQMPEVTRSVTIVRSYGFNLLFVFQNEGQVVELDRSKLISGNCDVQVVFTPNDPDDAKRISERLGTYGIDATSKSKKLGTFAKSDNSQSVSQQARPLMLPQEVLEMSLEKLIVFVRGRSAIFGDRITYYNSRDFMPRLMKAPELPMPGAARPQALPLSEDTEPPAAAASVPDARPETSQAKPPPPEPRAMTDDEIADMSQFSDDELEIGADSPFVAIRNGADRLAACTAWQRSYAPSVGAPAGRNAA